MAWHVYKPGGAPAPEEQAQRSVFSWTEELRQVTMAVSKKDRSPAANRQRLFYLLQWTTDARGFGVTVNKGRDPESAEELWSLDRALSKPPRFVSDEDRVILRLLWAERSFDTGLRAFGLGPAHGSEVLQLMAETGRLCRRDDFSSLTLAVARPAVVSWLVNEQGRRVPLLTPEPEECLVIPLPAPWYLDLDRRLIGPLQVDGNPAVVARLFSLPPLSATAAALVGEALSEPARALPTAAETASVNLRSIVAEPLPVLRLQTLNTHGNRSWRAYAATFSGGTFDVALPVFRYADVEVKPDDTRDFSILASGEMVRIERQRAREEQWMDESAACGLEKIPGYVLQTFGRPPDNAY